MKHGLELKEDLAVNQFRELISTTAYAELLVGLTLLVILVAIAFYFISWFKELAVGGEKQGSLLNEFQELRNEGKLSKNEYENVKRQTLSVELDKDLPTTPEENQTDQPQIAKITPTDAPPISLAEALSRKNKQGSIEPIETDALGNDPTD